MSENISVRAGDETADGDVNYLTSGLDVSQLNAFHHANATNLDPRKCPPTHKPMTGRNKRIGTVAGTVYRFNRDCCVYVPLKDVRTCQKHGADVMDARDIEDWVKTFGEGKITGLEHARKLDAAEAAEADAAAAADAEKRELRIQAEMRLIEKEKADAAAAAEKAAAAAAAEAAAKAKAEAEAEAAKATAPKPAAKAATAPKK